MSIGRVSFQLKPSRRLAQTTKFSRQNLRDVLFVNSFETHPCQLYKQAVFMGDAQHNPYFFLKRWKIKNNTSISTPPIIIIGTVVLVLTSYSLAGETTAVTMKTERAVSALSSARESHILFSRKRNAVTCQDSSSVRLAGLQ